MSHDTAVKGGAARVPVVELLVHLQQLSKLPGSRPALFVVRLHRSDALQATAQDPDATRVLRQIAERVEQTLHDGDRYCIAAVDEVWIVLARLPSEAVARIAAATLRQSLLAPIAIERGGRQVHVARLRPALGYAIADGGNAMALLQAASDACRRAEANETRVEAAARGEQSRIADRARIEVELRRALFGNELTAHFQPQIRLSDRRCVSLEALVRWPRDADPVSPALIASICEERGMMPQLTQFIVNTSLRAMAGWRASGIDLGVAINLAAQTLSDESFPDAVAQSCAMWGVSPSKLTFELTEGSIIQNERVAIAFMRRLRELGCELSIDDFGTGYSSFAYLRQLPVNELKIDRLFVRNIATDVGDQRIVRALVDLSHGFGLRALAEGAELPETIAELERSGCDLVQGYYFAKAMPGDTVAEWVNAFHGACATAETA